MPVAKIVEGQTATNPATGEKIVYRAGKWAPIAASRAGSLSPQEQKSVTEAQESARYALDVLPDVNRFDRLNALTPTGGAHRWNDAVQGVFDPNFQQLQELSARFAPAQRQPGSGSTSDRDLALFQQASPDRKKGYAANAPVLDRGRAEVVRRQQYADFLDKYAAENGTLNGAQQAFRKFEGLGTRDTPYEAQAAGDRSTLPRGAYYTDPQGNLRRNDNGPRGNPIVRPGSGRPQSGVKTQGSGWKVLD